MEKKLNKALDKKVKDAHTLKGKISELEEELDVSCFMHLSFS